MNFRDQILHCPVPSFAVISFTPSLERECLVASPPFLPRSVGTVVSSLVLLSSPSAPASAPRLVVSLPVLGAPTPASLPKSGSSWTHLLGQGLDRRPLVGTERTDLIRVDFDPTSTQRLRPFWRHRTSPPFQSHMRALQVAPVDHAPRALRITTADYAHPQSGGYSPRAPCGKHP